MLSAKEKIGCFIKCNNAHHLVYTIYNQLRTVYFKIVNYSQINQLMSSKPTNATVLLTFLKYFDVGFWLKEASYKEQPEVHFKHQFIVFLQGLTSDSYVAYSTYQNFNNLVNDKLRIPVTKVL